MDEIDYTFAAGGGTMVTMKKNLAPLPQEPALTEEEQGDED
jgi:hypothetical protein